MKKKKLGGEQNKTLNGKSHKNTQEIYSLSQSKQRTNKKKYSSQSRRGRRKQDILIRKFCISNVKETMSKNRTSVGESKSKQPNQNIADNKQNKTKRNIFLNLVMHNICYSETV